MGKDLGSVPLSLALALQYVYVRLFAEGQRPPASFPHLHRSSHAQTPQRTGYRTILPADRTHFSVADRRKGDTVIHFDWEAFKREAGSTGADVESLRRLLTESGVKTRTMKLLDEKPRVTDSLADLVTETIKDLCAAAKAPRSRSAARILSQVLGRFEEDVSTKFSPETVYWEAYTQVEYEQITCALDKLLEDRNSGNGPNTSTAETLYELSLKEHLFTLVADEAQDFKPLLAQAQWELACCIARLDAVTAALATCSEEDASSVAEEAWERSSRIRRCRLG